MASYIAETSGAGKDRLLKDCLLISKDHARPEPDRIYVIFYQLCARSFKNHASVPEVNL